jgi:Domain of unknown function (DUF4157)
MARARPLRKVSSPAPPVVGEVLRSTGAPLDRTTRAVMGTAFGQDFSGVRVHTDERAARSARELDANAYTVGQHVVFGSGRYRPHAPEGRALLAHELAHVVQRGSPGVIRRQRCGHDGKQPECGGYRWGLVNIDTGATTNEDLDYRIVELGMRGNFGGTWATQVQTPANTVKGGTFRGWVDGLRVRSGGGLLVEVVEVKSRATQFAGGCARATLEATEYVRLLNGLGPDIVTISQVLAANPALHTRTPNAAARGLLAVAGVDLNQARVQQAWNFFHSLEEQQRARFTQPFATFAATLNRDGAPGTSYPAGPPVLVDCTKRGKPGVRVRQLMFQVNGAGGVSYGCTNTECQTKEEQERDQPVQVPVAEERRETQPSDVSVPVLVGVGAAAATGVAAAAARRRAAEIAARRAAIALAEREAAKRAGEATVHQIAEAAARRRAARAVAAGAGKRVAGKAVGKVIVYAEAAAIVLVLMSGEAKAEVGPGQSGLEALYQLMTRNGTPPSPEMRELIENDPVLRQLAEQAAQSGDASGLRRELDRQGLEFLRSHAHELSDEELEILLSSANARGAGGPPPASVEELKAAIAAERERRRTGGPAAGTTTPGAAGGTGPGRVEQAPGGGQAPAEPARHPELSAQVRRELATAPPAKRRVVEALIAGHEGGPRVTDESVRRILAAVPGDLTAAQADRLIERVGPATGRTVDEIVESVRRAVAAVRGGQEQDAQGAETPGEPQRQPTAEEARATRAEYTQSIIEYINGYTGWSPIGPGGGRVLPIDRTVDLGTVALGTTFDAVLLGRTSDNPSLRYAGTGRIVLTSRTGRTATIEIRSTITAVREDRTTFTVPAGRRYERAQLIGGRN